MLAAFGIAFGLIFAAELGDKTQLMVLAFATRFRPLPVLGGVLLASVGVSLVSVLVGSLLGHALPLLWINLLAGAAFIGFGLWTLRGEEEEDDDELPRKRRFGPLITVCLTFFLAELGDKTMLATITIASRYDQPVAICLGAALGLFSANILAVVAGRVLGKQLPKRPLRYGAAAIFILSGLWILSSTIWAGR
ncbi:MAG TPA: TMEM165/GDT1 family protein [Thermoanaerobaculia bacterium]|nr:TMEM165/GDT1 family protein [Thermoanaerobaculia bacterium]